MSEVHFGYNLGLETCQAYEKFFDHKEAELNTLIEKIAHTNHETKIISDFMNKLSHAKKAGTKADFSKDDAVMDLIDHIHERNPSIFETKKAEFNEKEIEIIMQALDAELKGLASDLNENMMKINNKYEDRSQMTEHARKVLQEAGDLIQSILRKINR